MLKTQQGQRTDFLLHVHKVSEGKWKRIEESILPETEPIFHGKWNDGEEFVRFEEEIYRRGERGRKGNEDGREISGKRRLVDSFCTREVVDWISPGLGEKITKKGSKWAYMIMIYGMGCG